MERYLGRYSEPIYCLMRLIAGLAFMQHGAQKLLGMLGGQKMPVGTLPWVTGLIEIVAGLLIAIGLAAGWAAFIASGEMAVAYFMVHAKGGFWPVMNKGELAVVYCFVFLYIATRGAGRYSLDAVLSKPKR
jgi:putative oxidoreductase